jgi:hypothetical protein
MLADDSGQVGLDTGAEHGGRQRRNLRDGIVDGGFGRDKLARDFGCGTGTKFLTHKCSFRAAALHAFGVGAGSGI